MLKTYKLRPSIREVKSLDLVRIRHFLDGSFYDEQVGRLYRWQGTRNGVDLYRDVDGNAKPITELDTTW